MKEQSERIKTIKIKGHELAEKVRELIEEGNARHLIIKKDEKTILEVPLTIGAAAAVATIWLAPLLAALGALGALISDVTVVIEEVESEDEPQELEEADIVAETSD